jgi:hypothetical protein
MCFAIERKNFFMSGPNKSVKALIIRDRPEWHLLNGKRLI